MFPFLHNDIYAVRSVEAAQSPQSPGWSLCQLCWVGVHHQLADQTSSPLSKSPWPGDEVVPIPAAAGPEEEPHTLHTQRSSQTDSNPGANSANHSSPLKAIFILDHLSGGSCRTNMFMEDGMRRLHLQRRRMKKITKSFWHFEEHRAADQELQSLRTCRHGEMRSPTLFVFSPQPLELTLSQRNTEMKCFQEHLGSFCWWHHGFHWQLEQDKHRKTMNSLSLYVLPCILIYWHRCLFQWLLYPTASS